MKRFRYPALLVVAGLLAVFLAPGCAAYNVPHYEDIDSSESAFLIPLEGSGDDQAAFNSAELLEKRKISARRVQITKRWNSTGRMWFTGDWIPNVKLYKVDRKPVTRCWAADNKNAIWIESEDGVTFAMGFNITAEIPEDKAAIFLYRYRNKSLEDVIDSEVRSHIQAIMGDWAANDKMEALRTKRDDAMTRIRKEVPQWFADRGIVITKMGLANGTEYENKQIQLSIDKTIQDQMEKVSAKAREEAQEIQNRITISKAKADAEADAERLRISTAAKAEAEKIKAKGEADAFQMLVPVKDFYITIKQLEFQIESAKKWNGAMPSTVVGETKGGNGLMFPLPSPAAPPK